MLSASRIVLSRILVPSRWVASMVRTLSLNAGDGFVIYPRIRLLFKLAATPAPNATGDEGEYQQKRDDVTDLTEASWL